MGNWDQLGTIISGTSPGDQFGESVHLSDDGLTLAIAAPRRNQSKKHSYYTSGGEPGISVYQYANGTWQQIGDVLTATVKVERNISLSGDGSVVAFTGNNSTVSIYKNVEGDWNQIGSDIEPEGDNEHDQLIISLSKDGSIIAIGSPSNDDNGNDSGHVRIFQNINNTWTQIGSDIDGEASGHRTGSGMSLSGDGKKIAINMGKNGLYNTGATRVFQNIDNQWVQLGNDITGEYRTNIIGNGILSEDGSRLFCIAYDLSNDNYNLKVHIYDLINNSWQKDHTIFTKNNLSFSRHFNADGNPPNLSHGASNGWNVTASGDGSVVALSENTDYEEGFGTGQGQVSIYKKINGNWTQVGSDIYTEEIGDRSQYAISLDQDGSNIAIGSWFSDSVNGSETGVVEVYSTLSSINQTPTAIALSSTSLNETIAGGSTVATLSTTDPDSSDTHAYSLVGGTGSGDNASFTIDGSSLKINSSPDYETKSSYNIRLKTTDAGGASFQQAFSLSVNDSQKLDVSNHIVGDKYELTYIRDYDGNLHANTGSVSDATKSAYKYQGLLDVNKDDIKEAIYTNKVSGRWVTASVDSITGEIDYSKHGQGGTTRIVGIYIDPLVASGDVVQGSDHDSQRRFQNDLKIDNLLVKTSGDYDGDGTQEVYWKTVDGSAYLRSLMHADGNIKYANYQNLQEMTSYLAGHGFADTVALIA